MKLKTRLFILYFLGVSPLLYGFNLKRCQFGIRNAALSVADGVDVLVSLLKPKPLITQLLVAKSKRPKRLFIEDKIDIAYGNFRVEVTPLQ